MQQCDRQGHNTQKKNCLNYHEFQIGDISLYLFRNVRNITKSPTVFTTKKQECVLLVVSLFINI
jgi:hypothetical protein